MLLACIAAFYFIIDQHTKFDLFNIIVFLLVTAKAILICWMILDNNYYVKFKLFSE